MAGGRVQETGVERSGHGSSQRVESVRIGGKHTNNAYYFAIQKQSQENRGWCRD